MEYHFWDERGLWRVTTERCGAEICRVLLWGRKPVPYTGDDLKRECGEYVQ